MSKNNRKYREEKKEWRHFFTDAQLKTAERYVNNGKVRDFEENGLAAAARVTGKSVYYPVIQGAPTCYSEDWDEEYFYCTCSVVDPGRKTYYGYTPSKKTCPHEAAVLLMWEQKHGPWQFRETDEEWEARKKVEEWEKEQRRREQIREKEEKELRTLSDWSFAPDENDEKDPFFNVPVFVAGKATSLYALHSAAGYVQNNSVSFDSEPKLVYDRNGRQALQCKFHIDDEYESERVSLTVTSDDVTGRKCSCKSYSNYHGIPLNEKAVLYCGHEIAALDLAWKYILENDPGDVTDQSAETLFSILDGKDVFDTPEAEESQKEKKKVISITPRILIQENGISLTFKIGKQGAGRTFILKNFRKLQDAIEEEKTFSPGKSLTLDFSKETTDDESTVWLEYIQGKIGDADRLNDRLERSRYGYYSRGVAVQSNERLTGAALDQFYTLAEGMDLEYEKKPDGSKGTVHIGNIHYKLSLYGKNIELGAGQTEGISVTGEVPLILNGQKKKYLVSENTIGEITGSQWTAWSPFLQIANPHGSIRFEIGKSRLAEFYYRVLPGLVESPYIEYFDDTSDAVKDLLPPEPMFTFRLDLEEDRCTAVCEVAYEDTRYLLSGRNIAGTGSYRDQKQEERVVRCVKKYFPEYDPSRQMWMSHTGDDAVFTVMEEGVSRLKEMGDVLVTERFSSRTVRRAPSVTFRVSVDSGLLDISLLSKEVSPEELLQVYSSYRLKKKYHKLQDGSFVDLSGENTFSSVEELAAELDISVEALISEKKTLPIYRALYLDHLLEEHEELVNSRDRTYRALIKGFHTIRDADYDVPENLEDVLRPYQVYGHKWMRTVCEAGFGGILADEMGLGKTLEAISVMESMKQEGTLEAALVVCPASLVYNWEEEIQRFSKGLSAVPVAGTAAVRKKILKNFGTEKSADVYITSYDLLRSDIAIYKELHFSIMLIDEAQYIKNAKAAMTKAVKVVHADKRMALTGTPIENRLAELWSIFDYLMPGFLYDYKTFSERYEVPITKQKNEAVTAKLKSMVGPFILRRRKEEVLKDLPPKLEEVRYARLEKEQRKLYDAQVLRMKEMLKNGSSQGEDKIRILAELTRIRQICCDPGLLFEDYQAESAKREACIELVRNAIGGGHRMLIFSQFTSMLDLLEKDLEADKIPYYKITGATPKVKRIQDVHAFNEGDVPVFLISLKAGGTGLNLTGADMVIHYDPWWNLAAQNQATDRAHRIGQTKTVTVYRLIARDTIEEKILQMQEAKKDLADAILSGEQQSLMSLTDEELLALL